MPTLELVENPPRRRRPKMSALQAKYFGGGGKKRGRKKSRRRNPSLMSLTNPRRGGGRRRSSSRGYSRRRRRNPSLLGGLGGFAKGFDLQGIGFAAAGMIGSASLPKLIAKWWPAMPTTGIAGYAVRAVSTWLMAKAVGMVVKSPKAEQSIMIGGLGLIAFELFRDNLADKVGLSGLGQPYVSDAELADVLSGYIPTPANLQGYVVTDRELSTGIY